MSQSSKIATIKIDGIYYQVPEGISILEACQIAKENIPTLCHLNLHGVNSGNEHANCNVCVVEVLGAQDLVPACNTSVFCGMEIHTRNWRVISERRSNLECILANHPKECLTCKRNLECELQTMATAFGVKNHKFEGVRKHSLKDNSSTSISRNTEKCILCRRCEIICEKAQTVGVYRTETRDFETVICTAHDKPLKDTACTFCAQCVLVCPTGALVEVDDTSKVWDALHDPDKYVVVQTAPAIRVSLGESFGLPAGTRVTGKMITALRHLGFDQVLDTAFGADLTVMEEATEFLHRLENGGKLPIITTCCSSWIKFVEHQFPDMLDMLSTCKSPHQMFGATAKSYLAQKIGIDPGKMVVVSVMPCLSKKFEASREELTHPKNGRDVDYVISTRELASMIKETGYTFSSMLDGEFDELMGETTSGVIFGTTGGVIESVVRTVSSWVEGKPPEKIDFVQLRGYEGVREAKVRIGDKEIALAIAHGLGNARKLMEDVRSGKVNYHAIEVMASPYGCVGGGGQPFCNDNLETLQKRSKALHREGAGKSKRLSHENTQIKKLYEEFLGKPGGEKAHEHLHTKFHKR